MRSRPPSFGDVFELRVSLRDVEPEIWRTLRVPADASLAVTHEVLQIAFGWQNCHLHDFRVGEIRFTTPDSEDELFSIDERAVPLGAVARDSSRFVYEYDFGDSWEHDIVVERVSEGVDESVVCTGGARSGPPEDSGGAPGYAHLIEVLANPEDEEYADMRTWAGRRFDPEKFDLASVNKKLAALSRRLGRRRRSARAANDSG